MNLSTLSGRVAVAIGVSLVAIALILLATHGIWFDNPTDTVQRRMDIIGQLVVGIGTAALAVVTWASVYETQQVVSGEDLRFRQSRMPTVVLTKMPDQIRVSDPNKPAFDIFFRNDGDGPAHNIQITVKGTVNKSWQTQRVSIKDNQRFSDPPIPGGSLVKDIPSEPIKAGSFLKPGATEDALLIYEDLIEPESTADLLIIGQTEGWTFDNITIDYSDVFGELFKTVYRPGFGSRLLRDFELVRPAIYIK